MTRTAVEFDPFRAGEVARTAPSTEPQREIITSAALGDSANIAFNEAVSLRLTGALDPDNVERALHAIVGRHDALRMTFTRLGDELVVTEDNTFALERRDFSSDEPAKRDARIKSVWDELMRAPMSLNDGPLFRAIWIQLGPDEAELVLLGHHVICDGWSFHVILEELGQLTGGMRVEELEPPTSFAEFAERQHARVKSNADADYWRAQFEQRPPVLDLPTDKLRPAFRTFHATRVDHEFGPELFKAIAAAAGKSKASVVNVVLAGVAVLLHRLSGVNDMAIGLPVARQGSEGLPGLVGHGVQLLPIRMQFEPTTPFSDVVTRAKAGTLDARDHFDFTFGSLVRDLGLSGDPSRVPLVPVIFNIDQPFASLTLGGATAAMRTVPRVAENFELFLNVLPSKTHLTVEATFNTDLFAPETMRSWLDALESLLADATATPSKEVGALRLSRGVPGVYGALNDTQTTPRAGTWLELFGGIAAAQPDAVAVSDGDGNYSYAELARRAQALAHELSRRGIASGDRIGLYANRSRELLVMIAGVQLAGAAYVPLDPSFPESRLAYMMRDSGARLLLTGLDIPPALADVGVESLRLPLPSASSAPVALPAILPDDIAYVIYTSGSTGQPKGVEVTHGGVANLLQSMAARPGMTSADTMLAVTTLSFDISGLELLLPLIVGGRVVVATRDEASDSRRLMELLAAHNVTIMQATPSTWRLLLRDGWKGSTSLTALAGGEPLPVDLVADLVGRVKALWNMYGPTETTIWSTCRQILTGSESIGIGRPIDNTQVYVMDDHGQPLPPGVPGELWIGGDGLARGYHGRADLTAERFVEIPEIGRLYRTGDRGRILEPGELMHLGRLDDQVKVRGFRIELQEIEAVLAEHPDVREAAVNLWTVKSDDVRIVACCVPEGKVTLAPISLRKHMRARLPEYMVPQYFLPIDAVPLSPSGKVDRKRLPTPVVSESRIGVVEAPADPVEATIASIWTRLVHPSRPVGRGDRFFEMGGHSLLGLEALRQIDEKLGVRLHPRVLYLDTLSEIATRCRAERDKAGGAEDRASRPEHLPDNAELSLTQNQERIYRAWVADPGLLEYHLPFTTRLTGPLHREAMEQALREVFARHTALRTVIAQGSSGPVQRVMPVDQMCVLGYSDLASQADPAADALAAMVAYTREPVDLATGPIVRMHLFRLGEDVHQLFLMPHQIAFDGWSFDIVLGELEQNYVQLVGGEVPESKPLELTFGDFASWQRGRDQTLESSLLEYWQQSLRDLPQPIAWPGAAATAAPGAPRIPRVSFVIPPDTLARYEAFCHEQQVSLPNMLLAGFAYTLGAAVGRPDMSIGLASSGRFMPEVVRMVGLFFGMLPVRLRITGTENAGALLKAVHATVQGSLGFQGISLTQLEQVAESLHVGDRFRQQVTFSFQDSRNRVRELGGLHSDESAVPRSAIGPDFEFWVRHTTQGLVANFDFRDGIVPLPLMEQLREDYTTILDRMAQGPSTSLAGVVRAWHIEPARTQSTDDVPAPKKRFGWLRA